MIEASRQRNVLPAALRDHGRLPPAARHAAGCVQPLLRGAINGRVSARDYEIEWYERDGGTSSSLDHAAVAGARDVGGGAGAGGRLAPLVCAGFTDSHWMRRRLRHRRVRFLPDRRR